MPTAKKKIGGLALFTRHADGSVSGPQGSPRQGVVVGLPATPAPPAAAAAAAARTIATVLNNNNNNNNNAAAAVAATNGHAPSQPLQPPADIIASRQELAASARLPVPRSGRYVGSNHQVPPPSAPAAMSPASQYTHPMTRTRTTVSEQAVRTGLGPNWDDSTVESMFDVESRAGSERYRGTQILHGRHYSSDIATRRARQLEHGQARRDELQPFVISDNGILSVIDPLETGRINPLSTSLSSGLLNERPPRQQEDAYEDARRQYEITPTKTNTTALRRTKLPYRDNRDPAKRNSFNERVMGFPPEANANTVGLSPERSSENGDRIDRLDRLRAEEIIRRKLEAKKERELQAKRSTVFESLTPIEDPTFNNTQAAVVPSSEMLSDDGKDDGLTQEFTPRPSHPQLAHSDAPQDRDVQRLSRQKLAALQDAVPQEIVQPRTSRQPLAAAQNDMLQESALARTAGRRRRESATKKRRHSPDYNDAELDAMSYSDLRKQDFDYDPQAAALRQTAVPVGGTIQDRLQHYMDTDDHLAQHSFFAKITVREWEDAGDWFMDQFTDVMQKMKTARKEKRSLMTQYEDEISAREEAVRGKIEGIEHTLDDLKQEGQTMMQGKDVEEMEF